jgi:hypothetical protein
LDALPDYLQWKEETGLGKSAFYDRLKEAEAEGLLAQYKRGATAESKADK